MYYEDKINLTWNIILMLFVTSIIASLFIYCFSPKHTLRYELDSGGQEHGIPHINVDIENYPDENIYLSKEISWSEAQHMVDSLNEELRKHPIINYGK